FRADAQDVIERRCRNCSDQRFAVAVELIVPGAGDGMTEVMPIEPRQSGTRLIRGSHFTGLGLRDPCLRNFGLRPAALAVAPDIADGIALIDQTARRLVAIAQGRGE